MNRHDAEDLAYELKHRHCDEPRVRRQTYSCRDRMCGASDCLTCHPEGMPDECEECGAEFEDGVCLEGCDE